MVRRLSAPRLGVPPAAPRPAPRSPDAPAAAAPPQARAFATEAPAASSVFEAARASAPRRLGRYELGAKIADGGMATVFVARVAAAGAGEPVGATVAIKRIRDEYARNSEFVTMFMDEAKIVSRLRHPNIVRYHDFGRDAGHVFLVMELLFGQSLWSVWEACRERRTRLRYDVVAWIGARVADGLHYAHELADDQGRSLEIVHRDVNATNIFVTYDGEVKIIDFGLAKAANRASKTAAGIIKGKVAYMSPEQAVGAPVDRRTDVFALGTTLWELSCDRRLFKQDDEVETLRRVHAAEVPDPTRLVEGFPADLWHALSRALARDRERRYPSAARLAADLDAFAGSSGGGVGPMTVAALMRDLFPHEHACPGREGTRGTGRDRSALRTPVAPVAPVATVATSPRSRLAALARFEHDAAPGEGRPAGCGPAISSRWLLVAGLVLVALALVWLATLQ